MSGYHSIDPQHPDPALIELAITNLKEGGLISFPTDTVYGLACDDQHPDGLEKLYRIKGRPEGKPIARLACDIAQVETDGGEFSSTARRLAETFWPGGMTLVLTNAKQGATVGYRVPDDNVAQAILRGFGRPLPVSSANLSGEPDSLSGTAVQESIGASLDLLLDAGPSGGMQSSTVLLIDGDKVVELRAGMISQERWQARL